MSRSSPRGGTGGGRATDVGGPSPAVVVGGGIALLVAVAVFGAIGIGGGSGDFLKAGTCSPGAESAAPVPSFKAKREVGVYWDGSGSMAELRGGPLDTLVARLDSQFLQDAEAARIQHYRVTDDVSADLGSATAAVAQLRGDSALQEAARLAGERLRAQQEGVALFISDLDVEIPGAMLDAKRRAGLGEICPGVALPSLPMGGRTAHAGATFARCLKSGLLGTAPQVPAAEGAEPPAASPAAALPSEELFIDSFMTHTATARGEKELHILLVSLDPALGSDVARGLRKGLDPGFTERGIVDTRLNAATGVACSWGKTDFPDFELEANSGGTCSFVCMGTTKGSARCALTEPAQPQGTWLRPAAPSFALGEGAGDRFRLSPQADHAAVVTLHCGNYARSGKPSIGVSVSQGWEPTTLKGADFSSVENVQNLYGLLLELAQGQAPTRTTTFNLKLTE